MERPICSSETFWHILEIQIMKKEGKLVHFDLLKKCHSTEVPNRLQKAQCKLQSVTLKLTTKGDTMPDTVFRGFVLHAYSNLGQYL